MQSIEKVKQILLHSIIDAKREKANEIIINWAKEHSFKEAFSELFEPVLSIIGEMWQKNKLSLAQGYLTGKIAEDVFEEAIKDKEFMIKHERRKGDVVIGNIEDDYHSLGRKLLAIFLKSAGWIVHDLGNDILAEDFVEEAIKNNARIIGVSAMMFTTAKNIIKVRQVLDSRKLTGKIQLAVGGAIFKLRPGLVEELGGNGTVGNAIYAPELFDQLWKKSLNHERE